MKRFVLFFLALGLVVSLSGLCLAAEAPLSVSDTDGSSGQVVYLTVAFNESVQANTVGIKCEFDESLLTALPELCTWGKTGLLSAFEAGNMGAWADTASADQKGKLCVLAFQVKQGVGFSQTTVTCTVVLKDDAKEMGTYTAEGTITFECIHSYGDWTSTGNVGHVRVCSLCGGKNTQYHDWDDGTEKPGERGMTVVTYTCLVCQAKTTVEVPTDGQPTKPTQPEQTEPSQEVITPTVPGWEDTTKPEQSWQEGTTKPEQSWQEGTTKPEQSWQEDTTKPEQSWQQDSDHSQSTQDSSQTGTQVIPNHTDPAQEQTHDPMQTDGEQNGSDYSHAEEIQTGEQNHTTVGGGSPVNGLVIFGIPALAVAAGVIFLKKKR